MTSQIVFMEHSPITTEKKPTAPRSMAIFWESILRNPRWPVSGMQQSIKYFPLTVEPNTYGTFTIQIFDRGVSVIEVGGSYFRLQEDLDAYLLTRGIALHRSLVALNLLRRINGNSSSVILLETLKYVSTASRNAITKLNSFLREARPNDDPLPASPSFLGLRNGGLVHLRSKDIVPPDTRIPLYRPGNVLGELTEPVNLDTVDYVIL